MTNKEIIREVENKGGKAEDINKIDVITAEKGKIYIIF